jgi:DNA-binding CsgD family transcriptional regulator
MAMEFTVYPYEAILNATTRDMLLLAVKSAVDAAGFNSFHYGAHSPVKANGDKARFQFDGTEEKTNHVLSNYPDSWFARYQSENYIEIDPIVRHCSKSILPVVWHQEPTPAEPRARKMFCEAQQHGLMSGVTFSVFGKNQEIGLLSLTTDSGREKDKRHVVAQLGHGYMVMIYTHEVMRRLQFACKPAGEEPLMTQREAECLTWVSAGRTSWEIAHAMNISERTVNFHIANACRKLEAGTRRHAAAKALALGLIHP